MKSYFEIPGFEHLSLEDSYVLAIEEVDSSLRFSMEFVLLEQHPLFKNPGPEERHCYRKGTLTFPSAVVTWIERDIRSSIDANGEKDFGNIDVFEETQDHTYGLEGDWGQISVRSDVPYVRFLDGES